jgi:hypothetical protein
MIYTVLIGGLCVVGLFFLMRGVIRSSDKQWDMIVDAEEARRRRVEKKFNDDKKMKENIEEILKLVKDNKR